MFDLTTFNLQHRTGQLRAARWLNRHVPESDVFLGNEMNNRGPVLSLLAKRHGYQLWQSPPDQKAARAVPMLARASAFQLRGFGAEWLSDPTDVGRAGAGPRVLGGKWAMVMQLVETATGEPVTVLGCHLAPSVYLDVRDDLHEQQVAQLAELVARYAEDAPVVLAGDMNVQPGHSNMDPLREVGADCVNAGHGWTHRKGHRLIDQVWTLGDVECVRVTHGRPLVEDDHRPTTVRLRLGA